MQHACVDRMAQQLAAMNRGHPDSICFAACSFVELLDRSAHGCSFLWSAVASGARHRFGFFLIATQSAVAALLCRRTPKIILMAVPSFGVRWQAEHDTALDFS